MQQVRQIAVVLGREIVPTVGESTKVAEPARAR
jgi:hypothetical protein